MVGGRLVQKIVHLFRYYVLAIIFLVGCAHKQTVTNDPEAPLTAVKEVESFRVSDPEPPQVVDQELEVIPVEVNERVEQWLSYFQGKGRPHMERYLARSTRYMTLMKRILRQNGLPEDLIYIALIESGFSSKATSRAAAVGYWQFIKGTGKRYGLEINALVDERRDPVLSTQAAAEYFKGLYSMFGSWYLAMASYNVGENRVKREVMNHYTRDFWELARKKRLPKETINYVPKFIAAKMIGKNPAKYGFTDIEYEKPIEFELVRADKPLNMRTMATKMGIEYEEFKLLNPKFRGEIAPLKTAGALELRVPVGQTQLAMSAARESAVEKVEMIADNGETETYKIKTGDSLYTIARKFRTSVAWLRDVNDLKAGRKLRIGMRIQVPERAQKKAKAVVVAKKEEKSVRPDDQERAASSPEVVKNGVVFYIVQPGDTLSDIADDYDSTIAEIRKMNKLSKRSVLKVGMRLRVPKDEGLPQNPDENRTANTDEDKSAKNNADSVLSDAHIVRSGENLALIAKKYGVTIEAIRKANNLDNGSVLKVGSRLVIPSDLNDGARLPASSSHKYTIKKSPAKIAQAKKQRQKIHIVKRGENLSEIAAKYRVSLETIRKQNQIKSRSHLVTGARLLIPNAQASE